MLVKDLQESKDILELETLDSYILNEDNYTISNLALYKGFQYRSKVEFLRFFIV